MFVLSKKEIVFHQSGNLDLMNGKQIPPQHNISMRIKKKCKSSLTKVLISCQRFYINKRFTNFYIGRRSENTTKVSF